MTEVQKKEMLFEKVTGRAKTLIDHTTGIRERAEPIITLDYTYDEMLTQIDFDLPV